MGDGVVGLYLRLHILGLGRLQPYTDSEGQNKYQVRGKALEEWEYEQGETLQARCVTQDLKIHKASILGTI